MAWESVHGLNTDLCPFRWPPTWTTSCGEWTASTQVKSLSASSGWARYE